MTANTETTVCQNLPQEIWNLLPKSAEYLKNIMKFSGYETIDAILRLESKENLQEMFDFVIMMKDVIDDPREIFGIFISKPEKVTILPGLRPVIENFL